MKTLCIDFDGVLHSYTSGWKGARNIPDPPVPGAMEWLIELIVADDIEVCIYSSRSKQWGGRRAMKRWLRQHFTRQFEKAIHLVNAGAQISPTAAEWPFYHLMSMPEWHKTGAQNWLETLELAETAASFYVGCLRFPITKPAAWLTIDDRAICFQGPGTWPTIDAIHSFTPWHKQERRDGDETIRREPGPFHGQAG